MKPVDGQTKSFDVYFCEFLQPVLPGGHSACIYVECEHFRNIMQIEVTLRAPPGSDYSARDLGHLLHKHPDRVHVRDVGTGALTVFFAKRSDEGKRVPSCISPLIPWRWCAERRGRVPGRGGASGEGLLAQYVNDRPLCREFRCLRRGARAGHRPGAFRAFAGAARTRPACAALRNPGRAACAARRCRSDHTGLSHRSVYAVEALALIETGMRAVFDLQLGITARLCDILGQTRRACPGP